MKNGKFLAMLAAAALGVTATVGVTDGSTFRELNVQAADDTQDDWLQAAACMTRTATRSG